MRKPRRISELNPGVAADGSELVPADQAGQTVRMTPAQLGFQIASGLFADSGPVAYLDLALPTAFSLFRLSIFGVQFSVSSEGLAFALSQDGGTTFINDKIHADSYAVAGLAVAAIPSTGATPGGPQVAYLDSLMNFSVNPAPAAKLPLFAEIDLDPGSLTRYAQAMIRSNAGNALGPLNIQPTMGAMMVNPEATVAPALKPATLLRILPFGNGDCNPPTSGHTITSGAFILRGVTL